MAVLELKSNGSTVHKRKGEDFNSNDSRAVIVAPSMDRWEACQSKLAALRESLSAESNDAEDDLIAYLTDLKSRNTQAENKIMQTEKEALEIQARLDSQTSEALAACHEESEFLFHLQSELSQRKADRDTLAQELQEYDDEIYSVRDEIAGYKQEISLQLEDAESLEGLRKIQVPRMQQQISLYAMCTGIKWDFAQERRLAGTADVPSQQGLRQFSIDPEEHSSFEIANQLWDMMEGKESSKETNSQ
jgi:septal ring factor EnvC (AmiA/AmiB activator)